MFRKGWRKCILVNIVKEPPLHIKMSLTQFFEQEKLDLFIFFFCGFDHDGQKGDAFYQSKVDTPCSCGPLTEECKGRTWGQSKLGWGIEP
ncbi:hypothetical protein Hanom_Chr08g00706141 [Helianthus anomalus]